VIPPAPAWATAALPYPATLDLLSDLTAGAPDVGDLTDKLPILSLAIRPLTAFGDAGQSGKTGLGKEQDRCLATEPDRRMSACEGGRDS